MSKPKPTPADLDAELSGILDEITFKESEIAECQNELKKLRAKRARACVALRKCCMDTLRAKLPEGDRPVRLKDYPTIASVIRTGEHISFRFVAGGIMADEHGQLDFLVAVCQEICK